MKFQKSTIDIPHLHQIFIPLQVTVLLVCQIPAIMMVSALKIKQMKRVICASASKVLLGTDVIVSASARACVLRGGVILLPESDS